MKTLFAICLLSCTLVLLSGCGGKNQKAASTTDAKYTVGFLMETYDLERWKRDESFFGDKSRSLGMTVLRTVADGDQDRQNKQAETLLTQGVNVLVGCTEKSQYRCSHRDERAREECSGARV